MFSDRPHLRRWAAHVLLVWVFGLAMGIANACALGGSTHHPDTLQTMANGVSQGHAHQDGEQSKASCLDFCEKSSIGAPQLKVVGDSDTALAQALPVSSLLWVIETPESAVGRLVVDSPHLPGGPPLRIAFQRLAL
jgi:hypothetical protein